MNVEVDAKATCYASEEIIIHSTAEEVFGILADINQWPQWQSSVSHASITGNAEEGKPFRWKAGGLNIASRFHTVNPNHEIGWTGRIWWIKAVHNWYITEEKGKTRVVVMESLKGLGSVGMRTSLKEGMTKNLKELKAAVEK